MIVQKIIHIIKHLNLVGFESASNQGHNSIIYVLLQDVEKFKRAAATSKLRVCLEAGDECWEDGVREATRERRHGDQEFGLLGEGKEEDEEGDVQIDSLGAGAGDVQIDSLGVGAGDVFQQADSLGTDTLGAGGEDSSGVDYDDFMVQAMAYRDPVGLWDGAGDDFPDPHTNFSGFLSYCGSSEEALTASLYVLTRQQIATGHTPPLASHKPLIYCELVCVCGCA